MTFNLSLPRTTKIIVHFATLILLLIPLPIFSQLLGRWTFNGTTSGTPGAYNTVSVSDFSSSITLKAYSGSVYYGENVWPAGTLNAVAYMQFSLTPVPGNALNVLNVRLTMRRSTTGSPSGSGPRNWALRSSLDGYALDLGTGTLTTSISTQSVTLPMSFSSLSSTVTFRVYGFNSVTTSGGSNRMVYEDINVGGSNIMLPSKMATISAKYINGYVQVSAAVDNDNTGNTFSIERSEDAARFIFLNTFSYPPGLEEYTYTRQYDVQVNSSKKIFYRIAIHQPDGTAHYSNIASVTIPETSLHKLKLVAYHKTIIVQADIKGRYSFHLFSSSGAMICKRELFNTGAVNSFSLPELSPGIYHGVLTNGTIRHAASVSIQ